MAVDWLVSSTHLPDWVPTMVEAPVFAAVLYPREGPVHHRVAAALGFERIGAGGVAAVDLVIVRLEAAPEAEQTVETDLSTFWSVPPQTEEVALHFALPESDALAVKRLGPPPFVRDQAAFTAVMERLYQQIGEYALLLALGDGESSQ